MFPMPLQLLAEVYSCTKGLFWRKCSLNDCTVLCSSKIKWSWEHFEDTMYVNFILCVILIFQGETSNFEQKYNPKTCTRWWQAPSTWETKTCSTQIQGIVWLCCQRCRWIVLPRRRYCWSFEWTYVFLCPDLGHMLDSYCIHK